MVFYLNKRLTHSIMFGIILKSFLSSMLWHTFHEDIIMRTRKKLLSIHVLFVNWKKQISVKNITFYLLKSVQNTNNSS